MTGVKRREVPDEEFEAAYYGGADEASRRAAADNRNVIKAVLKKYSKQLPEEDLEACGLVAMWKALQYHRDTFGQKFTTSLHRFADWECKRELRRATGGRGKHRPPPRVPLADVPDPRPSFTEAEDLADDLSHVRECVDLLPEEWQRTVIRQYYLDGMTMTQVGLANGCSKESARQKIRRSVEALREICLGGPEESGGVLAA